MASTEQLVFSPPHAPKPRALEAFAVVLADIKAEIAKSRRDWDVHEPAMWSRARGLSDAELTNFTLGDLVSVRAAPTSYGTIVLGSFRIPAVSDELGEGFVHVRIHDPPNQGTEDVRFHSIWTDERRRAGEDKPSSWRAIQTADTPLEFFNE